MDLPSDRMRGAPVLAIVRQYLSVSDDGEATLRRGYRTALHLGCSRRAGACRKRTGASGHCRGGHQHGSIGSTADRDERDDQVVVGESREQEILGRPTFEMIVDVEHTVAAIGDRSPSSVFHQLGCEGAIGSVVEAWQAKGFGHFLGLPALLSRVFLVLALLGGNFGCGAGPVFATGIGTMGHARGPRIGLVRIWRRLKHDLATVVEYEATILLQRQIGRELAWSPQATGEQQRTGRDNQPLNEMTHGNPLPAL